MEKVNVKVKKLHPDAVIPQYAKDGDAGFDLVSIYDYIIEPGETQLIRTGLSFQIPQGYEIQIRPRSGISLNTKLRVANSPGTIDAGYRGELKVIIENTGVNYLENDVMYALYDLKGNLVDTDLDFPMGSFLIRKGDRIAQGVLKQVPIAAFEEVDELSESERGDGGFGSSGVKTIQQVIKENDLDVDQILMQMEGE